MTNKKVSIADVTTKMYELLEPLEPENRIKVIAAAQTLLGGAPVTQINPLRGGGGGAATIVPLGAGGATDIKGFFDQKDPQNKGEELLVAARYRELFQDANQHKKEDFQAIIGAARRNFDSSNFNRDLNNAKTKGLFNKGTEHLVSYYGQQYVDTMPDRKAIKKLRRPKQAGRKVKKKGTRKSI